MSVVRVVEGQRDSRTKSVVPLPTVTDEMVLPYLSTMGSPSGITTSCTASRTVLGAGAHSRRLSRMTASRYGNALIASLRRQCDARRSFANSHAGTLILYRGDLGAQAILDLGMEGQQVQCPCESGGRRLVACKHLPISLLRSSSAAVRSRM